MPDAATTEAPVEPAALETAAEPSETQDLDTLPQWARDRINRANREAGKARIEKREFEEAKAAKAELEHLREAQKSEAQKVQERADKAERDAQDARTELLRERIARRHKIDDDDMDLLGAGTEEELEARAKKIAALKAAAAERDAVAPPSDKPIEKLRPGATPSDVDIRGKDAYPASWRTARTTQTRKE